MTEHHKHIAPTTEIIRLYLEGKLDDKTMHALEKQALDDPFLAEALDGFAEAPEAAASHHLEDLQARLSQRVSGKAAPKIRRLNYYWAAAAAMLVFVSTGLYMFINSEKNRSPLAVSKQLKQDTTSGNTAPKDLNNLFPAPESEAAPAGAVKAPAADAATAARDTTVANSVAPPAPVAAEAAVAEVQEAKEDYVAMLKAQQEAKEEHRLEHAKKRAIAMDVRKDSLSYNKAFAFSVDGAKADSSLYKNKTLSLSARPTKDSAVARLGEGYLPGSMLEGKAAGVSASRSAPAPLRLKRNVSGIVTDMNKNPLPGVSIKEKGSNNWALTDAQGRFSLKLDSAATSNLTLANIGFDSKELKINPQQNNLSITLNENTSALNDVVVVGYGTKKRLSKLKVAAEPEDGFEEFNDYLANNVRYTTQMSQANVDDSVEVSFDVNSDGTIGQFKIERSLHAAKDINKVAHAEAIRVLKDGPKWLPASKNKKKVRVKVFVPFRRKPAEAKE